MDPTDRAWLGIIDLFGPYLDARRTQCCSTDKLPSDRCHKTSSRRRLDQALPSHTAIPRVVMGTGPGCPGHT